MNLAAIPMSPATLPATPMAVSALAVCKSMDDRPILRNITMEIPTGTFIALLGANGAGKSTLLNLFSTLTIPDSGALTLFGKSVREEPSAVRSRIGLISHQPMLYRELSARENLELFGNLYGVADVRQRAADLLHRVGLSARANDPVKAFSRGMTQRVAIARALMHDPELILADEPFSGLDNPSSQMMEAMLRMLHEGGRTIILVNHDIDQSLRLAQRIAVLQQGRLALDQPADTLTTQAVLAEVCR